jgi:hypothetical protein
VSVSLSFARLACIYEVFFIDALSSS